MVIQLKQSSQKFKNYFLKVSTFILSLILIMNSNYVITKRILIKLQVEYKFFDETTSPRKLEETQNSDEICEKADEQLRKYYITGDLENIGEINNYISYENDVKDNIHLKALINIIDYLIYNDTNDEREDNLLKIDSIKDDVETYSKHMKSLLIYFVFVILAIVAWLIFLFSCCCNCCCCCCCKRNGCKIPLFIIINIFFALSISLSVYGLIKSNSITAGIDNTKCSILKFFDQILEGETKPTLPKWAGLNKINDILKDMKEEIEELREGAINNLEQKLDDINNKKITLKNKMEESGNEFYSPPDGTTYSSLYSSDEYNIESRGINGRYVLDLVKMFGRKVTIDGTDEENYEPKNSILDAWYNEYTNISKNADIYLEETINDLRTISDNSNGDIIESLEQTIGNINILKDFFNAINADMEHILINKSKTIDKYGGTIIKLFFIVSGSVNFLLGLLFFFICLCSGKSCADCCCVRCLFKYSTHLLWNILCLLMIISFILGFLFEFMGTIGNDIVSVVSFIISEDNLGEDKENFIVDKLGEAKDYLDICINGDGKIANLISINSNQNNSLNNLIAQENQINQIKNEFQEGNDCNTYLFYIDQLKARLNLSIIPMLIKDNYEINLPINDDENHGNQFLKFDVELESMNNLIRTKEAGTNKNEQWKINSNSPNVCGSGVDPIFSSSEFNPLRCRPFNRDWIQTSSYNDIKTEAKIISDILSFLDNANRKKENINDPDPKSFISILNNLKDIYSEFLGEYIITLGKFNNTLNKIIGKVEQYINDDYIFSFMNGKIIGINLRIMLKYIKTSLGNDFKNYGICFIILGFFRFYLFHLLFF